MKLSPFSGKQIVQVTNPDPFAKPVLRAPVLHTPVWMIACAQLARVTWRLLRFAAWHPVADLISSSLRLPWRGGSPAGPAPRRHHRRSGGCRGDLAAGVAAVMGPARPHPEPGTVAAVASQAVLGSGLDDLPARRVLPGRLLLPVLGPLTTTATSTGCMSGWSRGSLRTTSPTGPSTPPMGSAH